MGIMDYAIEILEKELQLLKNCLSEWETEKYPEAKKERNDKYKNIIKAIQYLKSNNL
jgi:RNA processing factor Prp31